MKIGLFFGSFNPIHIGHLIIANTLLDSAALDEVWFVITPQNPFKNPSDLLAENHRLEMVNLSITSNSRLKSCDIEFGLPKPNYTYDTLQNLKKKFTNYVFELIIGEDNLLGFGKWKNANLILKQFKIIVYPRLLAKESDLKNNSNVFFCNTPVLEISSTIIRNQLKNRKSITYLVHHDVEKYIYTHKLYFV